MSSTCVKVKAHNRGDTNTLIVQGTFCQVFLLQLRKKDFLGTYNVQCLFQKG